MHVTVAGKQVDTGEALQGRVRDGLQALAQKYLEHAVEAHVTFRRAARGGAFGCDINVRAGRGLMMRGEGEGADAHRAFETAAEHLAKRLRRWRRRVNDHVRGGPDGRDAAVAAAAPEQARAWLLPELPEEDGAEDATAAAAIVAEPPVPVERLAVAEAAMRLDLQAAPLVLFRNRKSGALSLVYRRPDGCIGWIETGEPATS